jgi:crossover junction endodeoxyribonuclease RusA
MSEIKLVLPYPVSANRYWRSFVPRGHQRAIITLSDEAKSYKAQVGWIAKAAGLRKPFEERICMEILLYPHRPQDWQKRMNKLGPLWDDTVQCIDLGNAEKVLSDALQGIIYDDDKRIWEQNKRRMEPDGEARVVVIIRPLQAAETQASLL